MLVQSGYIHFTVMVENEGQEKEVKQIQVIQPDKGIKLGLLVDLFNMNGLDSPIKRLLLAFVL